MSLLWLCKASKLKYPLYTTLQAKKIVQAEVVICSTKMNANAADEYHSKVPEKCWYSSSVFFPDNGTVSLFLSIVVEVSNQNNINE